MRALPAWTLVLTMGVCAAALPARVAGNGNGNGNGLRLQGSVEPVRSHPVIVPRLTGSGTGTLVIVRLVKPGTRVKRGELLIEFDRQAQIKTAHDRQAEYRDFVEQINRKRGEQLTAARARRGGAEDGRECRQERRARGAEDRGGASDHGRTEPAVARRGARQGEPAPADLRTASESRRGRHPRARDSARSRAERLEARREQRRQDAGRVADRRDGGAEVHLEERHDGRSAGRRGSPIRSRHHGRHRLVGDAACARA